MRCVTPPTPPSSEVSKPRRCGEASAIANLYILYNKRGVQRTTLVWVRPQQKMIMRNKTTTTRMTGREPQGKAWRGRQHKRQDKSTDAQATTRPCLHAWGPLQEQTELSGGYRYLCARHMVHAQARTSFISIVAAQCPKHVLGTALEPLARQSGEPAGRSPPTPTISLHDVGCQVNPGESANADP